MPNELVQLSPRNVRIWWLLAFQAGAVNAGGFLACNRFVTHTTGFATHFAYELATRHEGVALGMLSVPVFFLLGSMVTSYFVDLRLAHGRQANYTVPGVLIFACIALATALGWFGWFGLFGDQPTFRQDYLLLVLLCLASGLQNALVTNARGLVVRTTHLTGVTTDLAVGLVRTMFERRQDRARVREERAATVARFGIIASFVLGSAASAYLYLRAHYLGFLVPAATSLLLLVFFVNLTRKKETLMRPTALFLALLSLAAAPAFAAPEVPPPAEGSYGFSGSFTVDLKIHYEVVYAFNAEQEARLSKLRGDGYECWYKMRQTWLCKQFQPTEGAAGVVDGRVHAAFDGKTLELGELRGEPTLESKGEEVAEYRVAQNAGFDGRSWESYRLVMSQGHWSIRLGDPTELQFSIENGALTRHESFPVTESKTAYSVYVVSAAFRRM